MKHGLQLQYSSRGAADNDDVAQRFKEHREQVFYIDAKKKLHQKLSSKLNGYGGSIIEKRDGEKIDKQFEIARVMDLETEIQDLEEKRKVNQEELKMLTDTYCSVLQRKIVEFYYFEGLSWKEVALLVYAEDAKNFRRNCQNNRNKAMQAIRDKSKR